MTVSELLDSFDPEFVGRFIHLEIEGVEKVQMVSTDATPLLGEIKDWHVGYFDIDENDGRLFVRAEMEERPF